MTFALHTAQIGLLTGSPGFPIQLGIGQTHLSDEVRGWLSRAFYSVRNKGKKPLKFSPNNALMKFAAGSDGAFGGLRHYITSAGVVR